MLRVLGYSYRLFGRFTQRFPTDKDSKSSVKNVYYTIEARLFSIKIRLLKMLLIRMICSNTDILVSLLHTGRKIISTGYDTCSKKIRLSVYRIRGYIIYIQTGKLQQNYGQLYSGILQFISKKLRILHELHYCPGIGALLNGDEPPSVYGIWNNTGTRQSTYAKSQCKPD